jgi:hypothetical protein
VHFWLIFSLREHPGALLGSQAKTAKQTSTKTPIYIYISIYLYIYISISIYIYRGMVQMNSMGTNGFHGHLSIPWVPMASMGTHGIHGHPSHWEYTQPAKLKLFKVFEHFQKSNNSNIKHFQQVPRMMQGFECRTVCSG